MKLFSKFDSKETPSFLSPWSIIHFAAGGLAYQYKRYINFTYAELGHLAYELSGGKQIFEQFGFEPKHDSSFENNVTDQACFTAGWYLAPQWLRYDILVPIGFFAFSFLKIGFETPEEAYIRRSREMRDSAPIQSRTTSDKEDRARMVQAAKDAMAEYRDGTRDTHPGINSDFGGHG